ncbi:MAG: carboxypeptidase regulatory-like domain-containing protein, partial [Calditrichaeota bacterium]|nr:carboxypeptidase regulatory-like domain-containing protein [Calditrichota bacterium]
MKLINTRHFDMQHGRISVILFLVILSLGFSGFAQNAGKITGIVKSADGAALPGCNIIVENTGLGAATDGDGYFLILNLPPGDYEV